MHSDAELRDESFDAGGIIPGRLDRMFGNKKITLMLTNCHHLKDARPMCLRYHLFVKMSAHRNVQTMPRPQPELRKVRAE